MKYKLFNLKTKYDKKREEFFAFILLFNKTVWIMTINV